LGELAAGRNAPNHDSRQRIDFAELIAHRLNCFTERLANRFTNPTDGAVKSERFVHFWHDNRGFHKASKNRWHTNYFTTRTVTPLAMSSERYTRCVAFLKSVSLHE